MPRRPLCLYDDTSRWPLDHPVLKNGDTTDSLAFGLSHHLIMTKSDVACLQCLPAWALPRPALRSDADSCSADEPICNVYRVFEPHKSLVMDLLLSGPCIIIMTLPTTDDIWITAPLFQYPPPSRSQHNQSNLFLACVPCSIIIITIVYGL